jgi:hypothetical protein
LCTICQRSVVSSLLAARPFDASAPADPGCAYVLPRRFACWRGCPQRAPLAKHAMKRPSSHEPLRRAYAPLGHSIQTPETGLSTNTAPSCATEAGRGRAALSRGSAGRIPVASAGMAGRRGSSPARRISRRDPGIFELINCASPARLPCTMY